MDIWKYEQDDCSLEWQEHLAGRYLPTSTKRQLWAVSVRGRVFPGFETRRDALVYGKRIEDRGLEKLIPRFNDLSALPDLLAQFYRRSARENGYLYSREHQGWVKVFGETVTSGEYDDNVYELESDPVQVGLDLEVISIIELLEENLEAILGNVRRARPEHDPVLPPLPEADTRWSPPPHIGPPAMTSTVLPSPAGKIEPFQHYPHALDFEGRKYWVSKLPGHPAD